MPIDGRLPTHYRPFNDSLTSAERVDQLLEWLDSPSNPRFLAMYLSAVDHPGHWKGPNSADVLAALRETDAAIAYLISELKSRKLFDATDLVIVSDHGMTEQPKEQLVPIEMLIAGKITDKIDWIDYGPISSIIPRDGHLNQVYREISTSLRKKGIPCKIHRKDSVPLKYRYTGSARIPPLLVECALGWGLTFRDSGWTPKGQHGYDPDEVDMHALFLAHGPRIREGVRLTLQSNLDVYQFLAGLLSVAPLPSNGTLTLSTLTLR